MWEAMEADSACPLCLEFLGLLRWSRVTFPVGGELAKSLSRGRAPGGRWIEFRRIFRFSLTFISDRSLFLAAAPQFPCHASCLQTFACSPLSGLPSPTAQASLKPVLAAFTTVLPCWKVKAWRGTETQSKVSLLPSSQVLAAPGDLCPLVPWALQPGPPRGFRSCPCGPRRPVHGAVALPCGHGPQGQ